MTVEAYRTKRREIVTGIVFMQEKGYFLKKGIVMAKNMKVKNFFLNKIQLST